MSYSVTDRPPAAALALSLALAAACAPRPAAESRASRTPNGAPAAALGDATQPTVAGDLGVRLDDYLARAAQLGFSAAVLVARGDTVFVHQGYGLADRAREVPITPQTVFDIGSITKQFTAAAILRLQDEGKLRVTDSLGRFFPDAPPDKRALTLHQLLSHTAGLPLYSGDDYELVTRDDMLRRVWAAEPRFRPGERYEYSNPGFSVLAAVVEVVTGRPWEEYVHDTFLRPAGMEQTGYVRPQWDRARLARAYSGRVEWGTALDSVWYPDGPSWNLRGNGGFLSTAADLYRWQLALERGTVVSDSAARRMCQPVVQAGAPTAWYGYGCSIREESGARRSVGHGGSNGFFVAWLRRYPERRASAIVLSNGYGSETRHVNDRVADILFGAPAPALPALSGVRLPEATLQRWAGTYELPAGADRGGRFVVRAEHGRLVVDPVGQRAMDLLTGAAPDSASRARNARAEAIVRELMVGEFATLERSTSADAFPRFKASLERMRRDAAAAAGRPPAPVVLGTLLSWWALTRTPATAVLVEAGRGTFGFQFRWTDDRITAINATEIENAARTTFVPTSDTTFAGAHLALERPVTLRIVRSSGETRPAIAIRAGTAAETIARRVD